MMAELTIAIAKGRLQRDALELFARVGIGPLQMQDSRRLTLEDESKRFQFLFVKSGDVPVYVEHGAADCGVVGQDVLLETEADLLQPLSLSIGSCQIVVAAPIQQKNVTNIEAPTRSSHEQVSQPGILPERDYAMLRVATKYPRITGKHFGSRGQPVEIIELSGSVELAPVLGLADCIVDLVETGRTLRENGLGVVEVIAESTGRLVVNRASHQLKARVVSELVTALRADPLKQAK
jgi:ATP phosphoribosyltransferase